MKSEKQIEKEYKELQKQKDLKRKEKEKVQAKKLKEDFNKFKKVFDEKYKGRCFYGILDKNNFWDKARVLGVSDLRSLKDTFEVYYQINRFESSSSYKSIYVYFNTIYKVGKKVLYFNTYCINYDSVAHFIRTISNVEKHQKVLFEMYFENKYDNIEKEMYEKTKGGGFRFGSDTVSKFFEQFGILRCEIDKKEFNQILEKEIKQ